MFEAGPSLLTNCGTMPMPHLLVKLADSIDLEWEQLERDLLIPLMEEEKAARILESRFEMCCRFSYYASLLYFAHRIVLIPSSQLCTWLLSYL